MNTKHGWLTRRGSISCNLLEVVRVRVILGSTCIPLWSTHHDHHCTLLLRRFAFSLFRPDRAQLVFAALAGVSRMWGEYGARLRLAELVASFAGVRSAVPAWGECGVTLTTVQDRTRREIRKWCARSDQGILSPFAFVPQGPQVLPSCEF
ncbi:hypothetical protein P171DRAFT_40285 [Karstenula rhodostoma CBS 690.94]|uniref:Uncharacterized protein n=1 Tax=Karstenula rhodostoma CBS 690.94 TaxID=1392251 RepID=A0A9P4PEH0_9PLEO|nr:hypothetical protein P171DRAFT_40285 [Karstenula rhodostoma CBS 690.94]